MTGVWRAVNLAAVAMMAGGAGAALWLWSGDDPGPGVWALGVAVLGPLVLGGAVLLAARWLSPPRA